MKHRLLLLTLPLLLGSCGTPAQQPLPIIGEAPFLSEEQKLDIFYNNAARFLRLSDEEIAKHHGK